MSTNCRPNDKRRVQHSMNWPAAAAALVMLGIFGGGAPPAVAVTNYLDAGGATNIPARYYRVRLVP